MPRCYFLMMTLAELDDGMAILVQFFEVCTSFEYGGQLKIPNCLNRLNC